MMVSHYEVLGLSVEASAAAIRKAYRERAKCEHPDKGGSDKQFQRLQQAYEVLADTGSRRQYDLTVQQHREQQRREHGTARHRPRPANAAAHLLADLALHTQAGRRACRPPPPPPPWSERGETREGGEGDSDA